MTEQDIANMIKNKKRYESELLILQNCTDSIHDPDDTEGSLRYAIIKRRLCLIEHWLHLLPYEESELLQDHLIKRYSWKALVERAASDPAREIVGDARTLQRMQAKALKRLEVFTRHSFGNSLDFLIDDTMGEEQL